MTLLGELLAIASLLLFSANVLVVGPAAHRLPQDLGFLLGLCTNVLVGALVVVGHHLLGGPGQPPEWDAIGMFAVGGLLTSYAGRWLFARTVITIGPTRASALQITNPVFAAVAAWILLDEALPPLAMACGLAVLAGLYLTSQRHKGAEPLQPGPRNRSVPVLELGVGLLGALAYGLGNVARGAGVRDWEAPLVGSLIGATVGLLAYGLLNTDLRKLRSALRGADATGRRLWLFTGVLTIGGQTCLIAATLYIPVAIAVVISAAMPVVLLPISVLFLRRSEAIGVATTSGVLLILAGVAGLVLT